MKVEEYKRLKDKIEALRQKKARAEGALEQAERRLLAELGVESVAEAEQAVGRLEDESRMLAERLQKRLDEFAEKWGEKLEQP